MSEDSITHHLNGMYQNWFLDYASYVILERAVPHILDGFKPVQRRIMHSMKRIDDGRYNKVANIVGNTAQFHPHGDRSISDALVGLGQKNLLVDCQGNWGNIFTGDDAAAPRYIEARLSKFALDVVFNDKTTEWKKSYDGRNDEPITLPVKFPLLLAQGVEGIAVTLTSKVLPHNFNEICQAAISYLHGEEFQLFPDFQTGGSIDVSRYKDGQRGGTVRVRAKISNIDNKTLAITELPYGKTTGTLISSILKAIESGKIKARKVEDNTADKVEILIHLAPGVSSDKTLDALYAFTDCEVSISPNCCVIDDRHPRFLTVSDVLRRTTDYTKELLRQELEIRRGELYERLHFASLEKIFIEERIYKDKGYEQAPNLEAALRHIDTRLEPFKPQFVREITEDDIRRLLEIKMARILKFNKDKADESIARMRDEIEDINNKLAHLVDVTCQWFEMLQQKYGANYPRRTEIRSFDTIVATKVAEANEKLYINREEGFVGYGLKKDEFVCNCSDIDDIIIFYRDGTFKVVRVAEKLFVGETERSKAEKRKAEIIHVAVFKKNDQRTIYNVAYRDGKGTSYYWKRFNVTSVTRDKEYDITQGKAGSTIKWFTANNNGEAETFRVSYRPNPRLKTPSDTFDFSTLKIKGRQSMGNVLKIRGEVHRWQLAAEGSSTLGGREVWFDRDVLRLNYDGQGESLGEFLADDMILVVMNNCDYYITNFDPSNHFDDGIRLIEKYDADKVWTFVLYDANNGGLPYIKRICLAASEKKRQNFLGTNADSRLIFMTDKPSPTLRVTFGGGDAFRDPMEVQAADFIRVTKDILSKGKRLTTWQIASVEDITPDPTDEEPSAEQQDEEPATDTPDDNEAQPTLMSFFGDD